MDRLAFPFLALALQWFRPRHNAQLQLMEAQIRILRLRIDTTRIVANPMRFSTINELYTADAESSMISVRMNICEAQ